MRRIVNKKLAGFTLAEAMIATVILGIAAAGLLVPFISGASARSEGYRRTTAAILAADLMERIINTPFDEITSVWDNYTEPEGQLQDVSGAHITDPAYAHYARSVTCQYVRLAPETEDDQPVFILATVYVYHNSDEIASLSRIISR